MKKLKQIVPAAPGTTVIWYNHCHDITVAEPVLFWGVSNESEGEDGPKCSFVVPLVVNELGGFWNPLEMPERTFPEGDKRHDRESVIIAYDIPGWGRIQLASDTGSRHEQTAPDFVQDLCWNGGRQP
jgi:hypothetical protein